MKKLKYFISLLIIIFIIFLFSYLHSHDYKIEYELDGYHIVEEFIKKQQTYNFQIQKKDINLTLVDVHKYNAHRKLLTKIVTTENKQTSCLNITSKHVNLPTICYDDDQNLYLEHYDKLATFLEQDSYKNIKIDHLNNNIYFLWNYNGFLYLNDKTQQSISLFSKELYNLNLIYQSQNELLIPNYDEDYKFTKIYMINAKNGKVKDFKLRYEVYFDSYFLGQYKNNIYLFDNKNNQEYYIDIKKKNIFKTDFKLLIDNKWERVTKQSLKNDDLSFRNSTQYSYQIEDSKLYLTIDQQKILVTSRPVNKIIKIVDLGIYYLSGDTLYFYNPLKQEEALLKYSEWQFNDYNMIYIFNQK